MRGRLVLPFSSLEATMHPGDAAQVPTLLASWRAETLAAVPLGSAAGLVLWLLSAMGGSGPDLWRRPHDYCPRCVLASRRGAPVALAWCAVEAGYAVSVPVHPLNVPGRVLTYVAGEGEGVVLDLYQRRRLNAAGLDAVFVLKTGHPAPRTEGGGIELLRFEHGGLTQRALESLREGEARRAVVQL